MEYFLQRATHQIDEKNIRKTLRDILIREIRNAEENTVKKDNGNTGKEKEPKGKGLGQHSESDEEMEIILLPVEKKVAEKREKENKTGMVGVDKEKDENVEILENIVKDLKKKGEEIQQSIEEIEEIKNKKTRNNSPHEKAQNINGTKNYDNAGKGQGNTKIEKDVPCKNFIHRVCIFGNNCRYTHPNICREWADNGRCEGVNGTCKMPHPQICRTHIKQETCLWIECRYVHPRNTQQRRVPKQQRHEYRDNMDRKGNHRQTRDQNGYNQSHRQRNFLQSSRGLNQPRNRPRIVTEMKQEMRREIGGIERRMNMRLGEMMEIMKKMDQPSH